MGQRYKIGKVAGTNVAIGGHAHAGSTTKTTNYQLEARDQAVSELRRFISLLPDHEESIENPQIIRDNAKAAEQALTKKKLDRARIEKLVRKIAAGVAGVTALANAIGAVQTTVAHLFS